MKNVTYIIPLHVFNDDVKERLTKALTSLKAMKLMKNDKCCFVGPKDVVDSASKLYKTIGVELPLTTVKNDNTDVQTQINTAVMQCVTEYFCVLEYDDTFAPYWESYVQDYFVDDNEIYSIILPVNQFVKTDGSYVALGNEMALDAAFAENLNYISSKDLEDFYDFACTGAFIRTEDFISVGGLKPSLGIAAWYEFLLRMAYKSKVMYVVPVIGYQHVVDNHQGYLALQKGKISQEEGVWLIKCAKQEYFFKEDRNRKFGDGLDEDTNNDNE